MEQKSGVAPSTALLQAQSRLEALRRQHLLELAPTPFDAVATAPPISLPDRTTLAQGEPATHLRLYPDLALALLRRGSAAAGRVWLLLRHLDRAGRGWLPVATARQRLTGPDSDLRLCGWRRLRALLEEGEGLYWRRQGERIWLRSTVRVAAALGVRRFTGRPVSLPLATLLAGMGAFRAHLYAAFHSGRPTPSPAATRSPAPRQSPPISRAALRQISGVCRRSQGAYERRAGIRRQGNYALSAATAPAQEQARAWQHGRALFHFADRLGRFGPAGAVYLAWQLPNSYSGPLARAPLGRQKRHNQRLADLFQQGMTGNDQRPVEKRYYGCGALAARSYNRSPRRDLYWPGRKPAGNRPRFWHHLPAQPARHG